MTNPTAWRDLRTRALSALVLGGISLAAIAAGGIPWAICLTILTAGVGAEWAGLCGVRARALKGAAIPIALVAAGGILFLGHPPAALLFLVAASATLALATGRAALGQGILYIGPAYLSLLFLRQGPAGLRNILFLMAVVWASDIGAYLVGRAIGGPRLAPAISPGKTWSGAIGGTLIAVLAGLGAGYQHPGRAALLALGLSITAQAGDLFESAIKRHFGAKDSGWIIPGHGGLLDRIDGLLAAAPVAALVTLLCR